MNKKSTINIKTGSAFLTKTFLKMKRKMTRWGIFIPVKPNKMLFESLLEAK